MFPQMVKMGCTTLQRQNPSSNSSAQSRLLIGSSTDQAAGSSSAGSLLCGLGKWSDPEATGETFNTSLKQGFRAVSGSRVDFANLTESGLRGLTSGSLRSKWS